ncbi:hypothetical protein [Candidatus Manganitrophus noduliformans]|uniref:Uncharacterized protein n=1 Tax=Candidatus Manganitrophus noduliformans TaxID=2606439 RepID=A0A7X6DU96_9BACT|nr:hypothetical protein [Candidatus Manganitrophus noduliformans]NKE73527.1 hypothetical protein [Candidatus Manganitrophus noduliformans]
MNGSWRSAAGETVILVAHGAGDDETDARWLVAMNRQIGQLQSDPHCKKLRALLAATVREDWPEKREKAVAQLKEKIEEWKQSGRVVLISHRLRGAGPYRGLLEKAGLKEGEDYQMNRAAFAPHPVLTRWLQRGIERKIRAMSNQISSMVADREASEKE